MGDWYADEKTWMRFAIPMTEWIIGSVCFSDAATDPTGSLFFTYTFNPDSFEIKKHLSIALMKMEFYPLLYRIWQISCFSTSYIYITFLCPRSLLSGVKHLVLKDGGITLEVSFYSFKYFSVAREEITYLPKEPGWTTENWFMWHWFCGSPVPDIDTQHRTWVKTHPYQMRGNSTLSLTGKKLKPSIYFLYQNLTGILLPYTFKFLYNIT